MCRLCLPSLNRLKDYQETAQLKENIASGLPLHVENEPICVEVLIAVCVCMCMCLNNGRGRGMTPQWGFDSCYLCVSLGFQRSCSLSSWTV